MKQKVKFKRRTKAELDALPIEDGSLIFDTTNNEILVDDNGERKKYGGSDNINLDEIELPYNATVSYQCKIMFEETKLILDAKTDDDAYISFSKNDYVPFSLMKEQLRNYAILENNNKKIIITIQQNSSLIYNVKSNFFSIVENKKVYQKDTIVLAQNRWGGFVGGKLYEQYINRIAEQNRIPMRNTIAYIENGGIFTYTKEYQPLVKIENNIVIILNNKLITLQLEEVFNLLENNGIKIDRQNKTFKGTYSFAIVYDIIDNKLKYLQNSTQLILPQYIVLYAHHYLSTDFGLLIDYEIVRERDDREFKDDIPLYYKNHIKEKIINIRNNMMECGTNGDTFVFITDLHWDNNDKHSPALVKEIFNNVNINTILCGGDLINEGTKDDMSKTMNECVRKFSFPNKFFPVALGNHDGNSNGQLNNPERNFTRNDIYALMEKQNDNKVHYMTNREWSFWFDNEFTKTRTIFLDTNAITEYEPSFKAYEELEKVLLDVKDGWHIIFVAHWLIDAEIPRIKPLGEKIEKIMDGYNNKTTVILPEKTYNFATAKGHIELGLVGHSHIDFTWKTPSGIPMICSDSDNGVRSENKTYKKGTITEQSFDVITIDYVNKKIKCVKIGRGQDREIKY